MKPSKRKMSKRTDRPTLPEHDQTKRSVLNSLASLRSPIVSVCQGGIPHIAALDARGKKRHIQQDECANSG